MSAKDALDNFYRKQMAVNDQPHRKNGRPEWELTKKPCMKWFEENGWSMHVIEAKAVYNFAAGRYDHGQTEPGVSDSFGCTPCGLGAFVEFKAPGRRSTLRPHQREFLVSKIEKGAFAVVTDSVEYLENAWAKFQHHYEMNPRFAKVFLITELPLKRPLNEPPLFPEEKKE